MRIRVLLFGIAREIAGDGSIELDLSPSSDVNDLRAALTSRFGELEKLKSFAVAVNRQYAEPTLMLKAGDEVAVIPPVSGG